MTIMKTTIVSLVLTMAATVSAVPTTNTYVAVTNDWYNGNWSNVYELAQARFVANSNDLVAANIMVDYRGNDSRLRMWRVEGRESRDWRQVHV